MNRIKSSYLNVFLLIAALILIFLIAGRHIIFGSVSGKWVYPYFLTNLTIVPFLISLVLSMLVIISVYFSKQYIDKNEVCLLISWFILGFIVQAALRVLYPFSFEQIIRSDFANAFYNLTFKYNPFQLLSRYDEISKTLPFHTVTNMPGKILFFYFLKIFTSNAEAMGYLIIFFSNIGAVLIYYVCKYIFKDKLIALYCLILYLILPAKIFFFPILNTVSPVFILLCLFFILRYLEDYKDAWLFLLGFSLYAVFIFEPLLLTSGIIFLAILFKHYREKRINIKQLGKVAFYPLLSFTFVYFLLFVVFKFSAFKTFLLSLRSQTILNQQMQRSYSIWLIQNLKNFFINAGLAQTILFLVLFSLFLGEVAKALRKNSNIKSTVKDLFLNPGVLTTFSVALVIIGLDLSGIARGEVIRLWIFLMVFLQMIAAYFCAVRGNALTFYVVACSSIFQTALTLNMLAFVIP